jgi:type IV secretory pathway VirB10-like protein
MANDPVQGPKLPRWFSGLRIPPKGLLLGGAAVLGIYFMTASPHVAASDPTLMKGDITPINVEDITSSPSPSPSPSFSPPASPTYSLPPSPQPSALPTVSPQGAANNASGPVRPTPTAPPTISPAQVAYQQRLADDRAAVDAPVTIAPMRISPAKAMPQPRPAESPRQLWLRQGDVVGPMTLYTSATSEMPELLVAYLGNDPLYDSTHRYVIAPPHSKLIGHLGGTGGNFSITQNSTHLPANFYRIVADDRIIALGDQPAIDPTGTAGIGASVDKHSREAIKNLVIVTAIGALLNRGTGGCTNCGVAYGGSGSSVGGTAVQAAQGILSPSSSANTPTLGLKEGVQVYAMITTDVAVTEWKP